MLSQLRDEAAFDLLRANDRSQPKADITIRRVGRKLAFAADASGIYRPDGS